MLGSDPVYQYDFGLDPSSEAPAYQGVVTLEPVYAGKNGGGGEKVWVDWFFDSVYNGKCLSHAYTQAGQENSFGWPAMKKGLEMQFAAFEELQKKGVVIETLGESGRWFAANHPVTPAAAMVSENDWKGLGKRSVWYNSRFYRANLFADEEGLRLRDLTLFDENYPERYLDAVCKSAVLQFDNLPVIDGNRFSGGGVRAGGYLLADGELFLPEAMETEELGEESLKVTLTDKAGKVIMVLFEEKRLTLTRPDGGALTLSIRFRPGSGPAVTGDEKGLSLSYRGYSYRLGTNSAPRISDGVILLPAAEGKIVLSR